MFWYIYWYVHCNAICMVVMVTAWLWWKLVFYYLNLISCSKIWRALSSQNEDLKLIKPIVLLSLVQTLEENMELVQRCSNGQFRWNLQYVHMTPSPPRAVHNWRRNAADIMQLARTHGRPAQFEWGLACSCEDSRHLSGRSAGLSEHIWHARHGSVNMHIRGWLGRRWQEFQGISGHQSCILSTFTQLPEEMNVGQKAQVHQ